MVILSGIISPHIFDKHTINPNNNAILTKLFFSVLIRKIISFSYQKNTRKTATCFALAMCKAAKPATGLSETREAAGAIAEPGT